MNTELQARQEDTVLDVLLADRWGPARWRRIAYEQEVPGRLRELMRELPLVWRAYADGENVAFAAAEPTGRRAIAVRFFNAAAEQCAAGVWTVEPCGRWRLQSVLE